ncbi:MAG: hypothetical protein QOI74_1339 [Micromonosporaceae bacterium]|nr:hypothetical protein [Micromonosporaceae bacterium]MDT5038927.1 hypothetical protein [Micromonosporaceae bacterium]
MTRLVRRVVATALLATAFGTTLATATPAGAATSTVTTREDQVSTLINQQRASHNCGPLTTDTKLRTVARAHSADMVARNYFSHTSPDGVTFAVRIRSTGYTLAYAENIAWGYRSAADVVDGWMNSPGHRRNILNCAYNRAGLGVAYGSDGSPYYTQDFARA